MLWGNLRKVVMSQTSQLNAINSSSVNMLAMTTNRLFHCFKDP